MPLLALLVIPWVAAAIAALMPTSARNRAAGLAGLTALVCLVGVAPHFPSVQGGGLLAERFAWVPSLGLNLVLRLDGFCWTFCVLVLGIGALVMLYARYYLSRSGCRRRGRSAEGGRRELRGPGRLWGRRIRAAQECCQQHYRQEPVVAPGPLLRLFQKSLPRVGLARERREPTRVDESFFGYTERPFTSSSTGANVRRSNPGSGLP